MRWLLSLFGLGVLAAATTLHDRATAESHGAQPVVVEFFTSQGCSSCPPADEFFAELARAPGVIALALHVDYWDYLGWTDTFGRPEHTERQRAYAKAHNHRSIYTPQMIVQGEDLMIGHDNEAILSRIAAHAAQVPPVTVSLARDGGGLAIRIAPRGAPVGPAEVHLVEVLPHQAMTVEGGENAGYHHGFSNIVTAWATIARWDGSSALDLTREGVAEGDRRHVVIVQSLRHGPILGAARLP
jgi:hypothetical protein